MSYGGQSNAPWQRNVMQGHPQSGGFHQGTQMFMQNAQQNNMAAFGHGGMQGGGNMFSGGGAGGGGNSVSYPQPRSGLNPVAFQQAGGSQSHYNSIGTVTKMNNDCGLVNDEIFFYRNVCKGPEPKLGDRVIFEATYSNNGQFKWNATRVQLMQQPQPLMGSNKGSYSSVAPPNDYQRGQMRHNSPKRSPVRGRHDRDHRDRERLHRSRDRDDDEHERKRRREDHGRSRDRGTASNNRGNVSSHEARGGHPTRNEKERERVEPRKKERDIADREREEREREREKERAREQEVHRAGRRGRTVKRYMVQIPKALLTIKTANVQDLRQRYTSLYIPSDFFHANVKWSDTFTPDNPFSLRRPCQFHIMHEVVEPPTQHNPDILEPADANYLYSAKVMLMSLPPIAEIYKKCFENEDDPDHHAVHPSRLINFLVGLKGRGGPMAIGGPWSPSLDGENPDKDPSVLIRTAIRTCKALTGIDLSNCTQWYRFVELYYHRTEYKNMEKDGPPRVETVVIYLPDVHSCIPSIEDWQSLTEFYKNAADELIARRAASVAAANANQTDDNDKTTDVEMADNSTLADGTTDNGADEKSTVDNETSTLNKDDGDNEDDGEPQDNEDADEKMDDSNADATMDNAEEDAADNNDHDNDEADAAEAADENDEPAPEPTHYSLLDLKTMKVQEIRDELLARNLPDKGVRNVVMARLAKALNTEKAEETKNKRKIKPQTSPQKATKTANVTTANKDEEKMDVDTESAPKDVEKKDTEESKKKPEKKEDNEEKSKAKTATDKKNKGKNDKEDQDDWADIIDFELSDIVILDEYDSSKNSEETNLKEMTEKEKSQLIRRHTLPTNPHIIVHPNRQAKGGKFDCAIMSLSVLLDYHPDDTKERFFEVSLFAELFNDMLMRDFGFNIYKEFCIYKQPAANNNACEISEIKTESSDANKDKTETTETAEKDGKKETKDKDDEKEKSSKKESKTSSEDKSTKDQHNDDTHSIKSESRKRKLSVSTSTANGKERELSVSDKKMVVVKPQLLLSFVYFDTSHCGYIYEKHLEELFTILGLNLSRSQIKNVLSKFEGRQQIYYRKLTDKEESLENPPAIEDDEGLSVEELKRLAAGNNQYESIFGRHQSQQVSVIEGDDDKEDGLINFNGTVVHVGKLMNQINRTEKNYSDLEKLYNDLLKQHTDLQKDHTKIGNKIKDLQSELKNVSRKLTDANQDYYSLNRKYRDQNATLSYIYTRVSPYFVREKDKDKDVKDIKTEGSRDKDKDEKEKDKVKEVDKEKEIPKDNKEIKKEDKETPAKDDKEKDKVKEKEKTKDEKEKPKEDKEKEKPKDDKDKEKDKPKDEKEKEKSKDDKEKDKPKDDKEKEKPKDDKVKEKPKENKEKQQAPQQTTKDDKVKATPQKNTNEKSTKATNPSTPAVKKTTDSKPAGKVVKKTDAKK